VYIGQVWRVQRPARSDHTSEASFSCHAIALCLSRCLRSPYQCPSTKFTISGYDVDDGWTITHDPYPLSFGGKDLFVDLGAEEATVAAEKEGRRIAVEIQSFLGRSPVRSLEEAVGQYEIYRLLLAATDPDRVLYMAVSGGTYRGVLADQFGQLVVAGLNLRVVVFDENQERIMQWIG
jgi:hypothetical protein